MMIDTIRINHDFVVVGGGMSGLCAALAAARGGACTALVHNRPVLGGNASSEIRMHICGADSHGHRPHARETGILEEILLENRKRNPQMSYSVFDTILWEKAAFQENLTLYLNTQMTGATMEGGSLAAIEAMQLTTEKHFRIAGRLFIDATGDGTLAALAGADFMVGRESRDTFDEPHAPRVADRVTMGNTLLFKTMDMGVPVPFEKPVWANTYEEADLNGREHGASGFNYWWIELGGEDCDVIADGETLRDELLKAVYGVWDHIKNGGDHGAENHVLDWIGFLPGKRESRRIVGDYVLRENDLGKSRFFEDVVAYGGWPMDMHAPGGLRTRLEPTEYIQVPDVYGIPYRSLYSKDIPNLMIAGRAISASHMAFGSTRVMGTCAVVGQAAGTAAALAMGKNCSPRDLLSSIDELQQILMGDDAYLPGIVNRSVAELAGHAVVTASSERLGFECGNILDGIARPVHEKSHCWISAPLSEGAQWLDIRFDRPIEAEEVRMRFDSNLSRQLMLSMFTNGLHGQEKGIPKELVKAYSLLFYLGESLVRVIDTRDNHLRFRRHALDGTLRFDRLRVEVTETNGDACARIFEVDVRQVGEKRKHG